MTDLDQECGNGLGLSAITAKGDRWAHGFYCENQEGLPTQYEVCLVENLHQLEDGKWDFNLPEHVEPKGWLYVEEIGSICEAIQEKGSEAWDSWNR